MGSKTSVITLTLILLGSSFVCAEDQPTKLSLGLSYLATSGNASSQTGGLDVLYKNDFAPWGIEVAGSYLRAEQDGVVTAEKLFVGVRGKWTLNADLDLFLSASYLQDRFAGLDPRLLATGGATYKFLKGPEHELAFDLGLTWTRDDLVDNGTRSYAGALAAAKYGWNISTTAKLTEDLSFFPSFEQASDWRVESKTALQASVSTTVALKLTYSFRYVNQPVAGFGKNDTQTAASLVISLR
jgi:putative salt-induced outer membrane protein YdiY